MENTYISLDIVETINTIFDRNVLFFIEGART